MLTNGLKRWHIFERAISTPRRVARCLPINTDDRLCLRPERRRYPIAKAPDIPEPGIQGSEISIVMPFKALGMVMAIFFPLRPVLG